MRYRRKRKVLEVTTREDLHTLIDCLPEGKWAEVNRLLLECLEEEDDEDEAEEDYFFLDAPVVEPTPAARAALDEFYAEVREGRAELIPHEEVEQYLAELS